MEEQEERISLNDMFWYPRQKAAAGWRWMRRNSSYIIFPSSLFILHRLYPFSYFSLQFLQLSIQCFIHFSILSITHHMLELLSLSLSPLCLSLSLSLSLSLYIYIFPLIAIINVWVSASKWWCVFFRKSIYLPDWLARLCVRVCSS